jgi:transposase-like protein
MMRQPISYAWALHTDVSAVVPEGLPEDAYRGLEYARELAGAAKARSRQNVVREQIFIPLTIAALAARDGLSASTLRRWIDKARRELFGDLTDAAIYKRTQRQHQSARRFRRCEHPRCDHHLAAKAHGNQKYCNLHRTAAERVRRHRQKSA